MLTAAALFFGLCGIAHAQQSNTPRSRTITVDNQCSGTIYPAIQGPAATKTAGGAQPFGWEQPPGPTAFVVPDPWVATRIWARTGCQDGGTGCVIGACASNAVDCTGGEAGGQGATLAEFTVQGAAQDGDSYDVSMVDGFNLPMTIEPINGQAGGCETGSCGTDTDILTECDPSLVFPVGSANIRSCASPCLNGKQLSSSFDPKNSVWCCTVNNGPMPHDQCTANLIPFYQTYKSMCKDAYVFADDDANSAVFSCTLPDYKITFCPGGKGSGLDPPLAAAAVSQPEDATASMDRGATSYTQVQGAASTSALGPTATATATATATGGAQTTTYAPNTANTANTATFVNTAPAVNTNTFVNTATDTAEFFEVATTEIVVVNTQGGRTGWGGHRPRRKGANRLRAQA